MRFWIGIIIGLLFWQTGYGAEEVKHFRIKGYPRTSLGCQGTAERVGSIFGSQPMVRLAGAKCEYEKWRTFDLELRLTEDDAKPIIRNDPWPAYSELSHCMASLAEEEKAFVKETGLTPFFKFCSEHKEIDSWDSKRQLFAPVFYAQGTSKQNTKTHEIELDESILLGDHQAILNEILKKSVDVGVPLTDAFFTGLPKGYDSSFWFRFALSPNTTFKPRKWFLLKRMIQNWHDISFSESAADPLVANSAAECQAQLKEAEGIFSKAFSSPVVWFCTWSQSLFRTQLYHLRIKAGPESFQKITPGTDGEPLSNRYKTKAECEADKPTIVRHYKKILGDRVVGALCSWASIKNPNTPIQVFVYALEE